MKSVTLVAIFTVFVLAVSANGPPQHTGKQYGKQAGHHGAPHVAAHKALPSVGHVGASHSVAAHSSSFAHSSASAGSFSHGASHGGHSKGSAVHGHGHGGHIGH
uniref:Uncharacterized protein n=1 Tax=Anopheles atroparvus TaxID=41427 RepID=A0AAG5DDB6_ANOAO